MRYAFCSMALPLIASATLAAMNPPGEEMQLSRSLRGLPVVAVHLGGETLRLGIDTGTSRTLISAEAASRLGLSPRGQFSVGCAAGARRPGACAEAPNLRLGQLSIALECLGWLPEEARLAGAEDLDGLLGADVLAHVDLWLDMRRSRVRARFAPPGSLAPWTEGKRLQLQSIGRRPAIVAELAGLDPTTPAARLIVDSGSDGLILFGGLAHRTATTLRRRPISGRIETATASRNVTMVAMPGIRAGGSFFEIAWAGLLPHVVDRPEDGLLPLNALGPVLLDLSNGVVVTGARLRTSPRAPAH